MAHAGTPTGLAKQPATSSSLWKPLLTAIVILAIGFGLAMATSLFIGSRAASGPAVDRGYDAIEKARGAWALSGTTVDTSEAVKAAAAAKARAMSGVPVDTSYTSVENLRAQSGVTVDTSYDAVENVRALSGVTVHTSTAVEKAAAAKARAMSGVPALNGGYDLTPRGAHGQLP
jgi:hypothetical protein